MKLSRNVSAKMHLNFPGFYIVLDRVGFNLSSLRDLSMDFFYGLF